MIVVFCLLQLASSRSPIVLVPGFVDSQLEVSYDIDSEYWFCPSRGQNEWKFFDVMKWLPPSLFCTTELLQCHFDNATGRVVDRANVNITAMDFGGVKGIDKVMRVPGGFMFSDIYGGYIRAFTARGYEVRKDLFGAPYDWRLGAAQRDSFWSSLAQLVEDAYEINNGAKVVIIAHSQGSNIVTDFLINRTTKEWRKKYIKRVALLAPAWGGFGQALIYVWQGGIPDLPWVKIKRLGDAIRSLPGFMTLFPNHVVFGNTTIFWGDDGKPVTADKVPEYFIKHGIFEGENRQIFEANIRYLQEVPAEMDVETLVYYNSHVQTLNGMNFSVPNKLPPTAINVPGDKMVPAIGSEFVCNKWRNNPLVKCFNTKDDTIHAEFLTKPKIVSKVVKWAIADDVNAYYAKKEL